MTEKAALSVELGHVYLHEMSADRLAADASNVKRWLEPLLRAEEGAVSTCVLIDDYFAQEDGLAPSVGRDLVRDVFADHGLVVDHFVSEAACAGSVETMLGLICPEPRKGAGSRGGVESPPHDVTGWLSNGDAMRATYVSRGTSGVFRSALPPTAERSRDPRYQHAIFLDVQMWDDRQGRRVYACPTLAAWWQLIRLGVDRDETGNPRMPAGSSSRQGAPPLFAERTLTMLDTGLIEVEHAVRTLLRQLRTEALPAGHLDRIAYLFVPAGFAA